MKILLMLLGIIAGSGDKSFDGTSLVVKQVIKGVYDERRVETMAFTPPEYPKYFLD
jgi:hypothetical protein|tara:strand:- start:318 stop:485 length:168 start_codon:yes stop_codon:yes gene_type:complete